MLRSTSATHRGRNARVLLGFGLATAATAVAGWRSTRSSLVPWYDRLEKPPFQPPASVFGPVWSILYGLMTVSGWRIYLRPGNGRRRAALALWASQLGLNGLWSWLFFAQRRPALALVDSACLLAATVAYAKVARDVDEGASRLFFPYIGWVGFATLLNEEIVRRNPTACGRSAESRGLRS